MHKVTFRREICTYCNMALTTETSMSPIQELAGLEGNRDCMECGGPEVAYFVPDFGVFACRLCAHRISTRQVSVKSLNSDIYTDLEIEAARLGGNVAYRAFAQAWEVRDWFEGDRPDEYRQRLQAKARGKTLFSDRVSDSISSLFSWLDCKLTPVLQRVNDGVGNSTALGKVANVLEGAYTAYEGRVERELANENGCWYKLKRQVDDLAVVFQAKPTEYRPLLEEQGTELTLH